MVSRTLPFTAPAGALLGPGAASTGAAGPAGEVAWESWFLVQLKAKRGITRKGARRIVEKPPFAGPRTTLAGEGEKRRSQQGARGGKRPPVDASQAVV